MGGIQVRPLYCANPQENERAMRQELERIVPREVSGFNACEARTQLGTQETTLGILGA
jgi:hypothetical protein